MKTLAAIKKDIEFNTGLASLIEVLKSISVSQFRAFEQKMTLYKKFDSVVESFFKFIDPDKVEHVFARPLNKTQIVIAVTSDSGLLGGINMQVVHTALAHLREIPGKLVVVGERGANYARETGISFAAFGGVKDDERYSQAMQLKEYVISKMLETNICYLKVVYPHPVSFTIQQVRTAPLLPFSETVNLGIKEGRAGNVILESAPGDIIEYLARLWTGNKLFELLGYSRLAEFAARFMHLEGSAHRLKEMDSKLRLQYFRVRHELIDRNMRELFGARILYANKS